MAKIGRRAWSVGLVLGLATAGSLVPAAAGAQQAPRHSVSAAITVVANGLNTPRGVLYDARHHRVLVAEAGTFAADSGPCGTGEGGTTLCFGTSGSVFQYSLTSHSQRRIITGLPSEAASDGSAVLGLEALSLYRHHLNGVFGLLGTPGRVRARRSGAWPGRNAASVRKGGPVRRHRELRDPAVRGRPGVRSL